MRRFILLILLMAILGSALVAAAAGILLYTGSGLAWTLAYVERATGGSLQIEGPDGTLAGGVTIGALRYSDGPTRVAVRNLQVQLSPRSLLSFALRIAVLRCEEFAVTLAPDTEPPKPPVTLALPVPLHIVDARVARVVISREAAPLVLSDVVFAYGGDAGSHRLEGLSLKAGGVSLKGRGRVEATRPFGVEVRLVAHSAAAPAAIVDVSLDGVLEALRVTARSKSAEARATLDAAVAPFTARPLERLHAEMANVDLRAFDPRLPNTSLHGELALAHADDALAGTIQISNTLHGGYDRDRVPLKSVRSKVHTDMTTLQLSTLDADLDRAGRLTGTGTVALTRVTLDLRARPLNLAGLHSRLRKTDLTGRIGVDATMEGQTVRAAVAEGPLRLDLHAIRTGNRVEVPEVRARARGGEAHGRGRVALSGDQPFNVEGVFKSFDPAAWGAFPAGAINGRFAAKGSLKNRRGEATLALEPSRLRGEPLKGGGKAEMVGERIAATLDLELGGNFVQARGAFGSGSETLSVRLNAPRLAIIDPRLTGSVSGSAELTGSWKAPGAKFELAGKDLAYGQHWRAAVVALKGVYSIQPDGPLQLSGQVTRLIAPPGQIERGTVEIKGTRAQHTAALSAQGDAIDLSARAAGSWQSGRGWSGTVLEIANRGSIPILLEAPVTVEAGPDRLRLGAVAAQVIGGRVDMRSARYEAGRLASEGRFEAIPVRRILVLAGLPAETGGTLRLSGTWSLVTSPRWNGTVVIRRHDGDLALGAGNALPLGLDALTLDARVVDDRVELNGHLRSRVASGELKGSILPIPAPGGARIAAASPLRLAANIDVSRLAALSGVTDTTVRFDGRGRAVIAAQGTLREPLVTGVIEASDLSVAFPPEGVDLRNGALRAELAGNEIRVQSFSIRGGDGLFKANGVLTHAKGRRSTLEWQAERLTILNRPDRRLIVTGRGNAALEDTKLSLTGELRADSGLIELRASSLPALGDDVVIVGRFQEPRETPSLRRAALNLALDFGSNFRITGRGLDSFVAGRIRVQTNAAGNLLAKGEVNAVRGAYLAFGQRLELDHARLIFDGPLENPRLDIRAMRKKQAVEAGVQVSGTARVPFVRVISDPPLPENEALSWLVLGQGPRDASAGDLSLLPLAAAALLNQGESPGGGFAGKLGVDSIGMRNDTVAGRFITVGKRISDDIYVVFEQGVGTTAHALKLEYNLTRRWLIRAEAGTTSALGVFFRWAFD